MATPALADSGQARCLIIIDTEGEVSENAVEVHCLITEDTVTNGKIHEPIDFRPIPRYGILTSVISSIMMPK
jgi:hypothetical protein